MTGSLRSTARNPVAVALMGVLVLVFLILGVGGGGRFPDAFRTVNADAVVTAGGHSMSSRDFKRIFDQQKERLEQQAQQQVPIDVLIRNGFDQQILSSIGQDEAEAELLTRMGIVPSSQVVDGEIRKLPIAFDRVTGKFSEQQFTQFLANQGMTPRQAQDALSDELAQRHFGAALQAAFEVPRLFVALEAVSAFENRDITYFVLDPKAVPQPSAPSDADLMGFMKEHAAQLTIPQTRVITVVRFSAAALAPSMTVDPAAVQKEFDFKKDSLATPETRTLIEIPVKTAAQGQQAAARLSSGEDPAAIAKSLGAEPVSYVDKPQSAIPDRKLAQAAFAMKPGEVRAPVRGDLSLAAVKVVKITPGAAVNIDAARAKIEADLKSKAAQDAAYAQSQKFDDARQAGSNLAAAAAKAGVAPVTVGPVTAQGAGQDGKPNPILTDKILKAAFAAQAREDGDLQDAGPGEYFAVRVEKILPPTLPALADKRPLLAKAWTQEQFVKALRARAETLMDAVRKGGSLDQAAAQVGARVTHQLGMQRVQAQQYKAMGRDFLENVFAAKPGDVFAASAPNGVFIAKLDAVRPGDVAFMARAVEANRARLAADYLRDIDGAVKTAAQQQIKVTTNLTLARQALGVDPALFAKPSTKAK